MTPPPRQDGIERRDLLALATRKIDAVPRNLMPEQLSEATSLLADLYATGQRHGIHPDLWSAVANLGVEVLDASALRDQLPKRRPAARGPATRGTTVSPAERPDLGRQR